MDQLIVKVEKLYDDAQLPTKGSEEAAGWDLYAYVPDKMPIHLAPHTTTPISTGIAIDIESGWEGEIRPRSGIAAKRGLRPINTPGTIDADYRGPVIVALHNDSDYEQIVQHGERIAQMLFHPVPVVRWYEVNKLSETVRGAGGFGSTGEK